MKRIITLLFIVISVISFSQKQTEVSLELLDGSVIKGTTMLSDIDISTDYGKLLVPINKISHIDIGLGKDKSSNEKALSYLTILNNTNSDDTRKAAYQDLIKLGPKAISVVQEFNDNTKNTKEETQYSGEYTIDNALSTIKLNNNISNTSIIEDVFLLENNYTIGGNYNFTKLEVKTNYGNLTITKEKIKSIDINISFDNTNSELSLKLIAKKHISGNTNGGWLKTGVVLKAGQHFSITANGEITLASLSNAKYKPDGSTKAVNAVDYVNVNNDAPITNYYNNIASPNFGNVVYKIGQMSADNLKVGAKLNAVAKNSGMLLLSIYETMYDTNNQGSYIVKINLGK